MAKRPAANPARSFRAAAALALLLATAAPARAQHEGPDAATHAALLSANAVLGALTAGVAAWIRDANFARAFALGAAGGSLSYAGKACATAGFTGAPLVGRQIAAVGHSLAANAGADEPAFREVWLPLSPLRVRLPLGPATWGLRLDLLDVAAITWAVLTPELHFDGPGSLATGTPVFVSRGTDLRLNGKDWDGVAVSGLVLLSGDLETHAHRRTVVAHELVHVIQHDFAKETISYPVEHWALGRVLPGRRDSALQGGFFASAVFLLLGRGRSEGFLHDLVEREAYALVRLSSPSPLQVAGQ